MESGLVSAAADVEGRLRGSTDELYGRLVCGVEEKRSTRSEGMAGVGGCDSNTKGSGGRTSSEGGELRELVLNSDASGEYGVGSESVDPDVSKVCGMLTETGLGLTSLLGLGSTSSAVVGSLLPGSAVRLGWAVELGADVAADLGFF